jgi:glycosyltransferase involved in cell wall biosynthesis
MGISVVIPAYNEAGRITAVVKTALEYADEVIVVDDGSTDDTAEIAEQAGARVVRQQNQGYIAAIKRGFVDASGEIVVTLDADGEHDPSEIPLLVAPILAGEADMVSGCRSEIPRPSERFLNWLTNRQVFIRDSGTGMRALRRDLARKLTLQGKCICGIFVLEAAYRGARIAEVPITVRRIDKSRRPAWYHLRQVVYVVRWLIRFRHRRKRDK